MLTPAEGRRLLGCVKSDVRSQYDNPFVEIGCLRDAAERAIRLAENLLSAPPDPEAIKREAVREFAAALIGLLQRSSLAAGACGTIRRLAAERGVTLDDKPAEGQEGGESCRHHARIASASTAIE